MTACIFQCLLSTCPELLVCYSEPRIAQHLSSWCVTASVATPAGAQRAAVLGWVQAIEVAFTKTYSLVNTRICPGAGPELLHACLLGTLGVVKELAGRQAGELAETLAGAARVLMSKLQELASSSLSLGLPGDPLSQVRTEFECCYFCCFCGV